MDAEKPEYIFDGLNFKTLDEFYEEITKILSLPDWWGRNLDAFNDILRSGFRPEQGYKIIWRNSELSRKNLGYEETVKQLEKRLERCHPSNREIVKEEIVDAKNKKGEIVFDWLVEIIKSHCKGGTEEEDKAELILN